MTPNNTRIVAAPVGHRLDLQPGDMEPNAFICKGCGTRFQEIKYGAGFERCGAVMAAGKKYMLCPRCLSYVMEFLESLSDPSRLVSFTRELIEVQSGRERNP